MNSIDKITTLFPKLKQQLLFLKEREKLFEVDENNLLSSIDSLSITPTNSNLHCSIESAIELSTNGDMNDQLLQEVPIEQEMNVFFPNEYIIPTLPNSSLQDIETGALHKFGPHHTDRQVLVDTITYDLINKYSLL